MATQTVHATLPDNIQAARIRLCSPAKKPYLAGILFRLTPVAMKGLKTMAVDKHARLYFDPDEIWPIDVYETVLYHEVCHLLRDHAGRQECMHADPEKWNTAADAEINDDIIAEGPCKWPFEVVTPKTIGQKDGLLAEEYYANLPKQPQGKGQGKGQG